MKKTLVNNINQLKHLEIWMLALKGMAIGFFTTLIVSTFLSILTINLPASAFESDSPYFIIQLQNYLKFSTPFAIGITIGYFVKLNIFQIIGCGICSLIAAHSTFIVQFDVNSKTLIFDQLKIGIKIFSPISGDVFASLLAVVLTIYCFKILTFKIFYFEVIFYPLLAILLGFLSTISLSFITSLLFACLEYLIAISVSERYLWSIIFSPLIGVIVGMALPLPISSAALSLSLNLNSTSGLIAFTGTTSVTISFALMTYLSTKNWSKTLIIWWGTPMLLMANYLQNRKMLIIPLIIGCIVPLISTIIFGFISINTQASYVGLGFSTTFIPQVLFILDNVWWIALLHILFLQIGLPIILTYIPTKIMLKRQWLTSKDFIF